MKVTTAGETFTDIDAFACAVALAELNRVLGEEVEAVLPGELNHSVPPQAKNLAQVRIEPTERNNSYVIVDLSNPKHMSSFVDIDSVVEIYDHHFGFEDLWKQKFGKSSHIEPVGSCATLIFEQFEKRSISPSVTSAKLLLSAIASNTLNFNAQITKKRDHEAYSKLSDLISAPEKWLEEYFSASEKEIFIDVEQAVKNDTKVVRLNNVEGSVAMGQMELWNGRAFYAEYKQEIQEALKSFSASKWFLTVPSVSENKNYFYTNSGELKTILESEFNTSFNDSEATTQKLWLRKEILQKLEII